CVPSHQATYLVRPTHIEITTVVRAHPSRRTVCATFVKRPLGEALQELSDLTGISVVVDARVEDKLKLPVTATLKEKTNLMAAVRFLADMADLKVVAVENALYVTSKANPIESAPRLSPAP